MKSGLGIHWLVEFDGAELLGDARAIRSALRAAARVANVTLLKIELHRFGGGGGVAAVALLAESHISVHTWPEHGYAALDFFMCGEHARPDLALSCLRERLAPKNVRVRKFRRGHNLANHRSARQGRPRG